ncbi:unnamed protein product [Spodoptera littoralis]|uniref:C2H2-type domain-containing protein n=1 Tax=Spodoptera littoralis TaxID=7109 RepID=A0A9P0HU46_SPOLI|nr:unnamed protein product [Spodoptera littoralis]CAH1635333.1 unnamed protein product [Spodoptera littoralis]
MFQKYCKYDFNDEMEEEQQKKLYYCSYAGCASYFDRPYRLAQHFLAHNNIRPFPCNQPNCNKAYTNKSHLDRHMNSVHLPQEKDVVYSCSQCMKPFANRQNLKRHINTVHAVQFTCDLCKMTYKKKNQLTAHMYQHTGIKAFKCDICTESFVSLYLKKRHMRYHKTYKCEDCDLVFNHWSKYQKHKKSKHVQSYSSTPQQLKSLKSLFESNVTVLQPKFNLRLPGGERQMWQSPSAEDYAEVFVCNECKRTFKERGHIVRHLKTHGQKKITKTFPCPYENCPRFYSRKSNLKQHILVSHMQIYHKCTLCEAQLSTKAKLNYHMQLHYKVKPEVVPKTDKERKPRKDEGTFKISTALKLSGLPAPPEKSVTSNRPVNLSVKPEHIEVEVDVHV